MAADVWNPMELNASDTLYFLVTDTGDVKGCILNDFGKAVKAAQLLINVGNIKIQIIAKKGDSPCVNKRTVVPRK